MKFEDLHPSKTVRIVLLTLGVVIVLLLVFALGEAAGYRQAEFSARYGDGYARNFLNPRGGMFPPDLLPPGHYGTTGKIVSVALPEIVVAEDGGLERTVAIASTTVIRSYRDSISASDLKDGDFITVLGVSGDDARIEAKLVRVVPPPPGSSGHFR